MHGGNLANGNYSYNGVNVNFMKDKNGSEYGSDAISRIFGPNFVGHVGTDSHTGSMRSVSSTTSDVLTLARSIASDSGNQEFGAIMAAKMANLSPESVGLQSNKMQSFRT